MKKSKIVFIALVLMLIILFCAYFLFLIKPWTSFIPQPPLTTNVTESLVIDISEHKRQTPYDCGAFNVATLLNSLGKNISFNEVIKKNRKNMIPRLGVVPEVLVATLNDYDVNSQVRTFRWMKDEAKIETLKELLADKKPLIVLIKRHGYLHFVLLTGFKDNKVYFYDPLLERDEPGLTIDNNGTTTGNETLEFSEFINLWNKASVLGFYKNLAIIIDKP